MQLIVNGTPTTCPDGATLFDLLLQLGLAPNKVVAELNRVIVPAAQFQKTTLAEGDTLELLQFVGGG